MVHRNFLCTVACNLQCLYARGYIWIICVLAACVEEARMTQKHINIMHGWMGIDGDVNGHSHRLMWSRVMTLKCL